MPLGKEYPGTPTASRAKSPKLTERLESDAITRPSRSFNFSHRHTEQIRGHLEHFLTHAFGGDMRR